MYFLGVITLIVIVISFVMLVVSLLVTKRNRKKWGKIFAISCVTLVFLSFFQPVEEDLYLDSNSGTSSEESAEEFDLKAFKHECEVYDYENIARYPGDYVGSKATFYGQVAQVIENGNNIGLRLNVTNLGYGIYSDTIYVTYKKDSNEGRILENDMLDVYGTLDGLETYETVLGTQESVPKLNAVAVEVMN